MKLQSYLNLPIELEIFRPNIESSMLPLYKLYPYKGKISLVDSKFSGQPYIPLNFSYPKDLNGQEMKLLAQINFAQFSTILPFPKEGILQFFISPTIYQTRYSVEEHIFQHYFKVRYYPNLPTLDTLTCDPTPEDSTNQEGFPIGEEMAITYIPLMEPVSAMDYRIEEYLFHPLAHNFSTIINDRSFEDIYVEHFLGADHKIGGYPYFIHKDTRKNSHFLKRFDTLLLQIVSNDSQNIMLGDSGIIKFFINQHKLLNLDFSDIYLIAEQYD